MIRFFLGDMKKRNILKKTIVKELNNKTVLVIGGAGSIGSAFVKRILEYPVKSVRVLDIDEYSLFRLNRSIKDERLRLLLGSVLDKERLEMAGNNTDIVFQFAAIKNIEISEFNPIETIDTNINGTVNLIKMVMKDNPKKIINISTDKAVDSTTLYGTTKLLSERLITWAGKHILPSKFASIRLGNIIETKGNVFEVWNDEARYKKPLSITDSNMKRYFFHIDEAVSFILECIPLAKRGEIFVPKMKSYKIIDLSKKISKKHKIIGLRQGEKMEEILMTKEEISRSQEKENMWIIHSDRNHNK